MAGFEASTSAKGQLTVPTEVRKLIGLPPSGKVVFQPDKTGRVYLVAKQRSIKSLKGLVPQTRGPLDVDAAIAAEVRRRNSREGRD